MVHRQSRDWWTLVAVCIGTFMLLLDITVVMVALPPIQTALGADFSQLQWVVDAYALTLSASLLTAGSLADRLGHRRLFVLGLGLFASASLLCGLAGSPLMLILTRGAQGIGGALMFSTALALLGHQYRGADRKIAFAVWGAVTGVSVAVGPLVGGALINGLSWRWIFLVNVPIGAVAALIARTRIPESRAEVRGPIDVAGFVAFSAALATLVYALIRGTPDGWDSTAIVACLIACPVALAAFIAIERRARNPMFELSLLRKPAFAGGSVAAFVVNGTLPALLLYIVIYLQEILGYDALQTGMRLMVMSAGVLVFGVLGGRLSGRVPARLLLAVGLAAGGCGLLLMRGLDAGSDWTALIAGLFVAGAGMGLVNPTLASVAVDVVSRERAGMGAGINNTFRQVGVATGIAGLGAIFQHHVASKALSGVAALPGVGTELAHRLATGFSSGHAAQAIQALPPTVRQPAGHVARAAFTSGMDDVFLVAALVAFAGALVSLLAVRSRDFLTGAEEDAARQEPAPIAGGLKLTTSS
jgi:EmrB/QacA subfamily drug resistance transporter